MKIKNQFFFVIINLFQVYDDPLQMVEEKKIRYIYIASGKKRINFFNKCFFFNFLIKFFYLIKRILPVIIIIYYYQI